MWRLQEESTRQLETLFEQANGNMELLQALQSELQHRPSQQAQALLAEIQVESFRLQQGIEDQRINWDEVIARKVELDQQKSDRASQVKDMTSQDQACQILDAWMILETLTPQVFHSPETLASRGKTLPLQDSMPWDEKQEKLEENRSLYYQVYLGDIEVKDAHETLLDLYGSESEDLNVSGAAALAVATFNQQGLLVGDFGVGVACFGWSYGRARQGKIHQLPFWQSAERLLIRRLRKLLSPVDEYQRPRPLTFADMQSASDWLVENIDIPKEEVRPVRFAVRIIQSSKLLPPRSPLLNSFLLSDLLRARDLTRKGQAGAVLKAYLQVEHYTGNTEEPQNNVETVSNASAPQTLQKNMDKYLSREFLPNCRWPHGEHYELDALQQTAVNIALAQTDSPLFSIHGPPGTGKTTLLRDIIAGVLAQRAEQLCEFEDPEDAFAAPVTVKFGDQRLDIHPLDESLLGHEIIVCSKNNKAAENISLELPMKKALQGEYDSLDYFSQTMQVYLDYKNRQEMESQHESSSHSKKTHEKKQPSLFDIAGITPASLDENAPWGLIAAALGHSQNKKAYVRSVWLDELHGFKRYFEWMKEAWGLEHTANNQGDNSETYSADIDLDFLPASKEEALRHWRDARASYLQAKSQVSEIMADLEFKALNGDQNYKLESHPALNTARDQVFKAVIELHQAFILAAGTKLQGNLNAYFRVIAGARGSRPDLLPHLWASGALITPVISTTFASVHTMLHDMPSGSIGWVLVDEAGQASPQDAVGALMRARRAIVVGDPQQIEPVVSVPAKLVDGIAEFHHTAPLEWMAPDASVQSIADQANPFGVQLQTHAIGWPILVHRRCAEPMFSIINQMAYEGLMIQGAANPKGIAHWVHVSGRSEDKWCPTEGDACFELLVHLLQKFNSHKTLTQHTSQASDTFSTYIITPFRNCATALRKKCRQEKKRLQLAGLNNVNQWINNSIGTVHTFQGRQAQTVIFVLGAQEFHERGAREWATRKVNLCNVAVSRAQQSLYIIGNRDLWGHLGVMRIITQKM